MMMMIKREEIEEERESFISGGGNGMVATAVMVVEYLISSMSRDLLCKFPDNSAFDFDYTQSSIWSPLVPRHFPSPNFSSSSSTTTIQRKLSYDEMEEDNATMAAATILRKLKDNIKSKMTTSCMFNHYQINHKIKKKSKNRGMGMKKNKDAGLDNFSPIPSSSIKGGSASITPSKGWAKVLKAASRHFKKTIKKKDSAGRLKIPSGTTFPPTSFY